MTKLHFNEQVLTPGLPFLSYLSVFLIRYKKFIFYKYSMESNPSPPEAAPQSIIRKI